MNAATKTLSWLVANFRDLDRLTARYLIARRPALREQDPTIPKPPDAPFAEETSERLFQDIFSAIVRREHILIIGPRGSGKSFAGRRAIRLAEEQDDQGKENPAASVLVPGAQVVAQGNKELPRDYFFEPEFEFIETGDKANPLTMRLRQPPLMRTARVDSSGRAVLKIVSPEKDGRPDGITRYRAHFEMHDGPMGSVGRTVEHFVLFLDEINRFNDGVLDTLLLLLEERCVIYQGKLVEVPISVVATMNPPGYDVSARSLSPPLLSRFNTVKQLYTAGPRTLVRDILPSALKLSPDELRRFRHEIFAVAIVMFWGEYDPRRPSGAYISPEAREVMATVRTSASPGFQAAMKYVAEKSNYGPDARGTRDWIAATRRRLQLDGVDLKQFDAVESEENNTALARAAVLELGTTIANKLVLNFSPEAKPDEFRRLMHELSIITYELFMSPSIRQAVRKVLS